MDKLFISATDLLQDSFRLAAKIHRSGFVPDFIVGIWRGGAPVGIAIQEYFEYVGIETDHIAVRTSAYVGIGQRAKTIRVHGLHYLIEEADAGDSLLVVDDVFDSGHSIEALLRELTAKMRKNMPGQVRIATPWYKPANNQTSLVPDYFLHETDRWIVFPHELVGLTREEIAAGKPELRAVLEAVRDWVRPRSGARSSSFPACRRWRRGPGRRRNSSWCRRAGRRA
jgi:hypoxanthine phosphoribosyltransferase